MVWHGDRWLEHGSATYLRTSRFLQRRTAGTYGCQIADIGTLNESSLHAGIKDLLSEPGDELEVELDGFVIDIRRGDLLIEVQTGSFGAMGRKLDRLLSSHRILLVHPIATATYLHKPDARPRKSPNRGDLWSVLDELVSIPTLLDHPNLELDVLLVTIDKFQEHDPKARRGRGGWRTVDKRLREVGERHRFRTTDDLVGLMPAGLPEEFTTADIAVEGSMRRDAAQKLAYCLRALDRIELVAKTRAGHRYRWADAGA
ncbi:MAG: hypothetical protein AAF547_17655 [Actinomycetota bacterium]